MNSNEDRSDQDKDLRQRAEKKALSNAVRLPENLETMPHGEIKRLVHELHVHQIELELQNEELRRSQEELEASRARYFDLYDLAPVGYITISEKGLIIEANLTAAGLLGISRSVLLKQPLTRFILQEDQDVYYSHRKNLFDTGEPQECELRMTGKDGAPFWARIQAILADEADSATACRAAISDITDQKNAEELQRKLLEQDKMAAIGKLAGKMAHDFNNILGIIMGTSELLLMEDLPNAVSAEIEIIKESADRGRDLTKNLLFFARDQDPILSRFDLNTMIRHIIKTFRFDLKDVEVVENYRAGLDDVLADDSLLENALINLIRNAIHAMSKTEKPVLRMTTRAESNFVHIEIADNGCGIPHEWKERIFDPSVSLKGGGDRTGAYRRDIKGSGYGLSNVKRCMDKHGGTIECESEEGKGTVFKLTLPIVSGELSSREMAEIRIKESVKGKHILVVEDEPHLGRILCTLLGKCGHFTTLAVDAKMALDHLGRSSFDVVSLDFVLPDMNGQEVYKQIRETGSEVPVVFVSGNFEYMQSMMDLKIKDPKVDHLAKPFSNVEYVNMIQKWLE